MLASVAEQASLNLTWSETPEDRFSHDEAHMYLSHVMRKPAFAICKQQSRRSYEAHMI